MKRLAGVDLLAATAIARRRAGFGGFTLPCCLLPRFSHSIICFNSFSERGSGVTVRCRSIMIWKVPPPKKICVFDRAQIEHICAQFALNLRSVALTLRYEHKMSTYVLSHLFALCCALT